MGALENKKAGRVRDNVIKYLKENHKAKNTSRLKMTGLT